MKLSSHCFPVGVIEYEAGGLDTAMVELTARSTSVDGGEGGFGDGRHEATWLLLLYFRTDKLTKHRWSSILVDI
jgi:hypothetical protein